MGYIAHKWHMCYLSSCETAHLLGFYCQSTVGLCQQILPAEHELNADLSLHRNTAAIFNQVYR